MSNSTTLLDLITSSQATKEVTANAMFDAASPAMFLGRRASTTSGLNWGYYGSRMLVDGVLTAIASGSVLLTASTTNYVEATRAGVVSKNTTGFTAGSIPMYTVVTGVSTITSYTDERAWVDPAYMTHNASVAVTSADVTLTAAQARVKLLTITGALTGNRAVIVPNAWYCMVYNSNTGAFTTTFKTSAGAGIVIPQGTRAMLYADGTNVVLMQQQGVYGRFVRAMADANYTLVAADYANNHIECTGALTAVRDIVVPLTPQRFTVFVNTSGGFGVRFIAASGTGVTIADGTYATVMFDGTNVVAISQKPVIKDKFVKAMADANQTLTNAQCQNNILEATGALTALRDLIIPNVVQQFTVFANVTGGFGIRVIGASGTGITIADGKRAIVYFDGTNVVRVTADT